MFLPVRMVQKLPIPPRARPLSREAYQNVLLTFSLIRNMRWELARHCPQAYRWN